MLRVERLVELLGRFPGVGPCRHEPAHSGDDPGYRETDRAEAEADQIEERRAERPRDARELDQYAAQWGQVALQSAGRSRRPAEAAAHAFRRALKFAQFPFDPLNIYGEVFLALYDDLNYVVRHIPSEFRSISSISSFAILASILACLRSVIGPLTRPGLSGISASIPRNAQLTSNHSASRSVNTSVPVWIRPDGLWPYLRATRSRICGLCPAKKLVHVERAYVVRELYHLSGEPIPVVAHVFDRKLSLRALARPEPYPRRQHALREHVPRHLLLDLIVVRLFLEARLQRL